MTQLASDIKQSKLCELNNLIAQYNNGETENINVEEYPVWVKIVGMLKTNDIDDSIYDDFLINPNHYKVVDNEIVYNSNWEEEEQEAEAERISNLSLTAADVERAIYKAKSIDFDDIVETVTAMNEAGTADVDIKALKIELKANNFYRGNTYVETIGTLLGFSSDDLDYLFQNGELPSTESGE